MLVGIAVVDMTTVDVEEMWMFSLARAICHPRIPGRLEGMYLNLPMARLSNELLTQGAVYTAFESLLVV